VRGEGPAEPEDFVVEESLAYEPAGEGDHLFLRIEKRGVTTLEAVRRLARFLGREHLPRAEAILARIRRRGLPNAYGPQRFGRGGASLAAGRALLRRDAAAFAQAAGAPPERVDPRLRSLLLSAAQSEVFNRVLARRLPAIGEVRAGDVATLRGGASFVVLDPDAEQPRAERFELSPSGPIPGTRLLRGFGGPLAEEDGALAELGITLADFSDLPWGLEARGARRPLRIAVEGLRWSLRDGAMHLEFELPSGSYATVLLRELLGETRAPGGERPRGKE
jgi:tRNA pseudouridine13 synthase